MEKAPKKRKVNGRWNKGNERYSGEQRKELGDKYTEQPGWRNGARVRGK